MLIFKLELQNIEKVGTQVLIDNFERTLLLNNPERDDAFSYHSTALAVSEGVRPDPRPHSRFFSLFALPPPLLPEFLLLFPYGLVSKYSCK